MDFEFWFFMGIAFVAGRISRWKYYIGTNNESYEAADVGILLRK